MRGESVVALGICFMFWRKAMSVDIFEAISRQDLLISPYILFKAWPIELLHKLGITHANHGLQRGMRGRKPGVFRQNIKQIPGATTLSLLSSKNVSQYLDPLPRQPVHGHGQ